jgi:hypothetical protein
MRTSMWLFSAMLLATTLAAEEGGVPLDPVGDAKSAVESFIRDFKPGMDTSDMNELTGHVRENSYGLTIAKDYRIVKPYIRWLSDTLHLPDRTRQNMLHTLGALGDVAAAKVVKGHATDTTMSPGVRRAAAIAICFLGNAEIGTGALKDLVLTKAMPLNTFTPWQFLGSGSRPVKLKTAADEKALTRYICWLAERATDENTIAYSISYLLQKDDESKAVAFRVAERALRSPDVYLLGQNDKRDLLSRLAAFGGERGKALAAQYEK